MPRHSILVTLDIPDDQVDFYARETAWGLARAFDQTVWACAGDGLRRDACVDQVKHFGFDGPVDGQPVPIAERRRVYS